MSLPIYARHARPYHPCSFPPLSLQQRSYTHVPIGTRAPASRYAFVRGLYDITEKVITEMDTAESDTTDKVYYREKWVRWTASIAPMLLVPYTILLRSCITIRCLPGAHVSVGGLYQALIRLRFPSHSQIPPNLPATRPLLRWDCWIRDQRFQ